MVKERICHICGIKVTEACPQCRANFLARPPAHLMTVEEKLKVYDMLTNPAILEIDWSDYQQWIEELVGRPVQTLEFAFNLKEMRQEIIDGAKPENLNVAIERLIEARKSN